MVNTWPKIKPSLQPSLTCTMSLLCLRRYCIQPPGDGPTRHATMDCLAAGTMPLFFDRHLTAVMPFADILDYADFTEYIDPVALMASQDNAIDVVEVCHGSGNRSSRMGGTGSRWEYSACTAVGVTKSRSKGFDNALHQFVHHNRAPLWCLSVCEIEVWVSSSSETYILSLGTYARCVSA